MKHVHAVIGAGWGDEGKGLAVDALAASLGGDVVVVRSNGGAQAGHGVHTPDGRHHVFHHIGAGSFTGARTHLSKHIVAHPMVFFDELRALEAKGVTPLVSMDPRAQITTPWDMAINQSLEYLRGGSRHGSCGLGFGETIERSEKGYGLSFEDLSSGDLPDILKAIYKEWVTPRLEELDLVNRDYPLKQILTGQLELRDVFIEDCRNFASHVAIEADAYVGEADHVIFEGAQGLRLDMDLGEFPHVTRSLTGLPNMIDVALEAGIAEIEVTYMTRAYGTRHGAGPMPHEHGIQPPAYAEVTDLTNAPNEWQGDIRYGDLDLDGMRDVIQRDLKRVEKLGVTCSAGLGITCLDQLQAPVDMVLDDLPLTLMPEDIDYAVPRALELPLHLASRGPHRGKVDLNMAAGEIPEASIT